MVEGSITVPIYIGAAGHHYPERRITNADLTAMVDTSEEWIESHTGIVERRRADDDVDTSDLGVLATRAACERAGWRPEELELLLCATSTPDDLIPPTASYIAGKLGTRSVAFDVNASCSGFVYGLAVAAGLVATQGYGRAALCTAEKYTRVVDYTDRGTCIFWGDSAATVLLQRERPAAGLELVDLVMENLNEGADLVRIPREGHFLMDGSEVKRIALEGMIESARTLLERNGLGASSLRAFMAHQANYRVLEALRDALGVSEDRHWHNVRTLGNQGAAGVVTTLSAGLDAHAGGLADGDLLLLTTYGSGFTGGSALLRWVDGAGGAGQAEAGATGSAAAPASAGPERR